jgi:D-serine deaminase-like pyridoxal phosphate-dependent protein
MLEQAEAISNVAMVVGRKVPVVIKLDTGGDHLGVFPVESIPHLAKQILKLRGVEFKGIYAHEVYGGPAKEGADKEAFRVAEITCAIAQSLRKEGIAVDHVSVGASSTFRATCQHVKNGRFKEINEIHPGKLAIDDIAQVMMQDSEELRRAVTVIATVISTSHPSYAVIDAGFKAFGFDALIGYQDRPDFFWQGKPSFGVIKGRPDLWFGALHAEVGVIFYKDEERKLHLGERLEIFPNNTTLVLHMQKELHGVRHNAVEKVILATKHT